MSSIVQPSALLGSRGHIRNMPVVRAGFAKLALIGGFLALSAFIVAGHSADMLLPCWKFPAIRVPNCQLGKCTHIMNIVKARVKKE